MAGMTGHRSRGVSVNSKAAVPAVKKKPAAGGGGQVQAQPAAPNSITYTWTIVASNPKQTLITFSQGVVWNGGVPVGWTINVPLGATAIVATGGVQVISPTQVILTWTPTVPVAANATLTVPQNDPTFKGLQGQFVTPGKQFSGPQK